MCCHALTTVPVTLGAIVRVVRCPQTRYVWKYRPSDNEIVLKVTDDNTVSGRAAQTDRAASRNAAMRSQSPTGLSRTRDRLQRSQAHSVRSDLITSLAHPLVTISPTRRVSGNEWFNGAPIRLANGASPLDGWAMAPAAALLQTAMSRQ
jgi:hypothetical protein